jgi:hypothetical protein
MEGTIAQNKMYTVETEGFIVKKKHIINGYTIDMTFRDARTGFAEKIAGALYK